MIKATEIILLMIVGVMFVIVTMVVHHSPAESHAEMDQMIARIIVLEQRANALAETCPKISP